MIIPQPIIISKTRGKKRHYTFDLGNKGTATLQYKSAFCKDAVGIINNQQWNFTRKGFWKKELEIVAQQSPYTKTHVKLGWRQKFLVRAEDNNMYHFKGEGFWRKRWIWYDNAGQKLMEIKSNGLSRSRRGLVTFLQPPHKEHYWLMMLGWFQLIIWEQETAATVAAG